MWCRNVLRTRSIRNKPTIFACLQCLTNNNLNDVTLKHSERRLLASDPRECTIGDVIDQWSRRFESEGISEPVESIEHIVAHVIGTKKVSTTLLCSDLCLIIDDFQRMIIIDNQIHFARIF